MRILLINVPIRLDHPPVNFPTGLGIIAQMLVNAGHDVRILDANAHRYDNAKVVELAVAEQPEAIGVSGLISTYNYQNFLIPALRQALPKVPIISGGGCATAAFEPLFAHTPLDIAVIGEGEHTAVELLQTLDSGGELSEVAGIIYRDGERLIRTPSRPLETDLDRFPMAAYRMFPTEIYAQYPLWDSGKRSLNLITSRGCPMDCNFCYNLFGHRSYRTRSAEAILEEVRFVRDNYDLGFVGFCDDNLTIKKPHLKAVCDGMRQENIAWGCHGRVDTLDDERLEWMASSGCTWLGFGIESASPAILASMNKRITPQQAKDAILRTRRHGIFANTTFIFGYPGETRETITETLRFQIELGILTFGFFATPYPGSQLWTVAKDKGLIPDDHKYMMNLNNAYDFTLNLTDLPLQDFVDLRRRYTRELSLIHELITYKVTPQNEAAYLNFLDSVLNDDQHLAPETRGHVLRALARYFESKGDLESARTMSETALSFGVQSQ